MTGHGDHVRGRRYSIHYRVDRDAGGAADAPGASQRAASDARVRGGHSRLKDSGKSGKPSLCFNRVVF